MKKSDDLSYIKDIIDAIDRINIYTEGVTKSTFFEHLMMQDATMHQIEIIGEASNQISDTFRDVHPDLPWMEMRAIRNKIVHDYRGIELEIIWDTVKNNLPGLKDQIKSLLES
ncbi:MAG: DUF86 domain-containing protein [Anaerolineales bacterium]|jgi:uncharacterized protein with HEPN domain